MALMIKNAANILLLSLLLEGTLSKKSEKSSDRKRSMVVSVSCVVKPVELC